MMTRRILAALFHDGHARTFLAQPRREVALRAAMIAIETVVHRVDRRLGRRLGRVRREGSR